MRSTSLLKNLLRIHKTGVAPVSSSAPAGLSGVFPPIVTPFASNQSVAWDKLEENVSKLNTEPLAGYLVHGSNGEFCYLDTRERLEMVKTVKSLCSPGKLLLAGSGAESTIETVRMTEAMAAAGADVAVVVTPSYYKGGMTGAALESHYLTVADASPIPVVLYSVPANTTLDLPLDTVIRLAQHKNIIGIKESGGDITKIASIIHGTRDENFQVIAGSASFLLVSLYLGAVGGICALANVLPGPVCQLMSLHKEGRHEEARALQFRLISPNAAVTKQFGVAGLKQSMDWAGYYGGPTRSPLQPLSSAHTELLSKAFLSSGFKL